MTYTYEDFVKAAQDAGMYEKFSAADLELAKKNPSAGISLLQHKRDYAGATSEMGRLLAHAGAEGIRKQYGGYKGGSDGSGYAVTGEGNGTFNSAANEQANAMLKLLENREPYSYDASKDPAAQSYRKAYAREGRRAAEDTMGTAAAMTGGVASSAAVSAAAQAGNYYAAQSADKIAELEELAYGRYQDEGDRMRSMWSMYRDQADTEYNKWLTERNLATEQEQAEYDRKYQLAVLAAQYGDYSGLKELGVDTSKWTSSSGGVQSGSSGGGGAKKSDDSGLSVSDRNNLWIKYPTGIVPPADWTGLVAKYGADALAKAGFKKGSQSTSRGGGRSGSGSGSTKAASESRVNMLM